MNDIKMVIVGDMNNERGRQLVQALVDAPELNVPYGFVHIDEVRGVLPGIRATPAVGVILWTDDLQEAVAISQVARAAAVMSAGDTLIGLAVANAPEGDVATLPVDLFDLWSGAGTSYQSGAYARYDGQLWRCAQAHTSQEGWNPSAAPSLWYKAANPGEEWPEWIKPTGAHDAYAKDSKVAHKGKHWVSTADGNVWEPGVYGWTEVTT